MGRNIQSFKVTTTIPAQRVVGPVTATAQTVKLPGSGADFAFGITTDTVSDTTQAIPVAVVGEVAELLFNDTLSSGDMVGFDTSGRGIPVSEGLTSTAISSVAGVIGINIGPDVALTGAVSQVLIMPMRIRVSA